MTSSECPEGGVGTLTSFVKMWECGGVQASEASVSENYKLIDHLLALALGGDQSKGTDRLDPVTMVERIAYYGAAGLLA